MTPQTLGEMLIRRVPLLRDDQDLMTAVEAVMDSKLPALPVVGSEGRLVGIFGEREFITAISPGYIGELKYAGFVPEVVDEWLEKRGECLREPVLKHANTEHIDVGAEWSDAQLAEIFLHHRVLIIPVVHEDEVMGVITRSDFFTALAKRALSR